MPRGTGRQFREYDAGALSVICLGEPNTYQYLGSRSLRLDSYE